MFVRVYHHPKVYNGVFTYHRHLSKDLISQKDHLEYTTAYYVNVSEPYARLVVSLYLCVYVCVAGKERHSKIADSGRPLKSQQAHFWLAQ